MANHPSAAKRARQNERRRTRNTIILTTVRSAVRVFREALTSGDKTKIETELGNATRLLRKAASKGVLHKRSADRKVSRLELARNAAKA